MKSLHRTFTSGGSAIVGCRGPSERRKCSSGGRPRGLLSGVECERVSRREQLQRLHLAGPRGRGCRQTSDAHANPNANAHVHAGAHQRAHRSHRAHLERHLPCPGTGEEPAMALDLRGWPVTVGNHQRPRTGRRSVCGRLVRDRPVDRVRIG